MIREIVEIPRGAEKIIGADLQTVLEVVKRFVLSASKSDTAKRQDTASSHHSLCEEEAGAVPPGSPELEADVELGRHPPRAVSAAAISARNR